MKDYEITFTATAIKALKKIPKTEQKRIIKAIQKLANNPRSAGTKKLQAETDLYRIRIGQYRVIYSIDDGNITLLVVKIGHRKDIYKH